VILCLQQINAISQAPISCHNTYRLGFVMKKTIHLALALSFLIGLNVQPAEAKRFVIPSDDKVLIEINGSQKMNALNPDSINLFVWNMYKGDKPHWKRDFLNLSRGKDVLMLQEVYLDYQMASVMYSDDTFTYNMATSFIDTKNRNSPTGVATASPVAPQHAYWVRSIDREPIIKTPKMLMITEYPIAGSGDTLLTVNIHAINFVSAKKLRNMLNQIEDAVRDHTGPVVVAGDFNTWSKKKTQYLKDMARHLGLSEVIFKNDQRMKTFGKVLDYVLIKKLQVINSKVYGEIDGSDHKAMEVHLKVRE